MCWDLLHSSYSHESQVRLAGEILSSRAHFFGESPCHTPARDRWGCTLIGALFRLHFNSASGIEDIDVLVADVADQGSLETMCARCTVIINCVGPVSATHTMVGSGRGYVMSYSVLIE